MNKVFKNLKAIAVFSVFLLSFCDALLRLFGAAFFASTSSFWTIAPALTLLALLPLLAVPKREDRLACVYALTLLYIASWVFEEWRLLVSSYARGEQYFFPGLFVAILVASLVVIHHLIPGEDSKT